MSIYQKLQTVRCEVNKKCNKKSGQNKYAGFNYFQLEDFLPTANEEFLKVGLCPVFSMIDQEIVYPVYAGTQIQLNDKPKVIQKKFARLRIFDDESKEYIDFETPVAEVKMGSKEEHKRNPIQELGASHTYLKRYLYMNALELSEGDVIDATIGKDEATNKKPTRNALWQLHVAYEDDELKEIRKTYNVESDDDLPRDVVNKLVAKRKDKIKEEEKRMDEEIRETNLINKEYPFY